MNKAYSRINWENYPSDKTPVNEQNLNRIDGATDELDNRVISLDTRKFDKTEAQGLIKNITFDLQTGILKKYYYNGSTEEINTGISKLNMNLRFDRESQILYIVNADGTEDPVDLSVFITNYEFEDSDTIAHNVSSDGIVTSIVKDGSITENKLQPNYLADIKVEVARAESAATAADASKTSAAGSASTASVKADEASASATSAASSATTATQNAEAAATSAEDAADSAQNASNSAATATDKANSAATSATNAANSATTATNKANAALSSANASANSATSADTYAKRSQSYAVGTGGEVRENDDTDCAEYYYEQAKRISQSISGVIPMGTISFAGLDNPDNQKSGYLFNISDSFTSDDRFVDGGGRFYGAGSNVMYTADGRWDVLAATMVSGVKGSAETEYRQGFVSISKNDIGLGNVGNFKAVSTTANQGLSNIEKSNARDNISALATNGDSKDNTVTFTSEDNVNPTQWMDVSAVASGEKHSTLWNKATTFFKNVRFLYSLIGNTPLSIGDGTVIGAINQINSNLGELNTGLIHQKVYLGINPNTGSVITVNCQSKINGVIYIDALIQTTSAATDQGDLLTISKDIYGNLINVPKRIDAVLMGSDQNYFVVCKKDTGVFKVNGATIPAGTYKLILIIDP